LPQYTAQTAYPVDKCALCLRVPGSKLSQDPGRRSKTHKEVALYLPINSPVMRGSLPSTSVLDQTQGILYLAKARSINPKCVIFNEDPNSSLADTGYSYHTGYLESVELLDREKPNYAPLRSLRYLLQIDRRLPPVVWRRRSCHTCPSRNAWGHDAAERPVTGVTERLLEVP